MKVVQLAQDNTARQSDIVMFAYMPASVKCTQGMLSSFRTTVAGEGLADVCAIAQKCEPAHQCRQSFKTLVRHVFKETPMAA